MEFEEVRQQKLLEDGQRIPQETRLWDEEKNVTQSMRSKEEAHDYRYFPEPDLVPFLVSHDVIEEIKKTMPELPIAKFERFQKSYELSEYDAGIIIQNKNLSAFFEQCVQHAANKIPVKKVSNWIIGPLQQEVNSRKLDFIEIKKSLSPEQFCALILSVETGTVSNLIGKSILSDMISTGKSAEQIASEKGLSQVSDESQLEKIIDDVLKENPTVVEQIKQGKDSAMGFLVGQSMRKSQGKGNPKILGELIKRRLQNV